MPLVDQKTRAQLDRIRDLIAAAPAVFGLALSGGLAWDPGMSFATFAGAIPAGWLAAFLARPRVASDS